MTIYRRFMRDLRIEKMLKITIVDAEIHQAPRVLELVVQEDLQEVKPVEKSWLEDILAWTL